MNYAVLTADRSRHIFFANQLEKICPEVVLYESKEQDFLEHKIFDTSITFNAENHIKVNDLNSDESFAILQQFNIDYMFIFGCRLLEKRILTCAKKDVINIHTGLTQHHRGVDGPHWAFIENTPQLIGSTIHSVTTGIDIGMVYLQALFNNFSKEDTIDDIFLKNCKHGILCLADNVQSILDGKITPRQYNPGKLYQKKDMTSFHRALLNKNLKTFLEKL